MDAKTGQVFSGSKALKRKDVGLAQDVIEDMPPKAISAGAKLFAHVYIDPADKPKTLMLQYFKGGWLHRAVWGDYDAIPWGKPGSTEKVKAGPLPESGKWVRLEIEAEKLGLKAGDLVTGFALTQQGGTVFWDKTGVSASANPASDPGLSLLVWWKSQKGKDLAELPAHYPAGSKRVPIPNGPMRKRVKYRPILYPAFGKMPRPNCLSFGPNA